MTTAIGAEAGQTSVARLPRRAGTTGVNEPQRLAGKATNILLGGTATPVIIGCGNEARRREQARRGKTDESAIRAGAAVHHSVRWSARGSVSDRSPRRGRTPVIARSVAVRRG